MSAQADYWTECIECAFDEAAIKATPQQVESVASNVEVAHENYGMAFYQPTGPSQVEIERDEARRLLDEEQRKVSCEKCDGSGRIITQGPYHSSDSQCWKCRGEGRHTR